jgi:hypothetical protein
MRRKVERKKVKKKHGLAYYVVLLFTLAIELMLGINAAFLVSQSVSIVARNMLDGTAFAGLAPLIALFCSLAVGACFVMGGMWTYAGFIDSLEDAKAYVQEYGTWNWPVWLIWAAFLAIIALDFTTLAFRAVYFAQRGETALLGFFIVLILLPPILGPLIHVLEHTPRDRRLSKVRQFAEALETDDMETVVQTMDPDLRSRMLNGDQSAIQEHYNRVDAMRAENAAYEQQKIQEREEKRKHSRAPLFH